MTHNDPEFVRASEWLSEGSEQPKAALIGVPFSALSISKARCDLLPKALRRAMHAFSAYASGIDLSSLSVKDFGDVGIEKDAPEKVLEKVGEAIAEIPQIPTLICGGDNSITAPAVLNTVGAGGGLITLDAHHDVRNYKRHGLSNGSPVRVLIDSGLPGNHIWQIGIQDFANSSLYSKWAHTAGINVIGIDELRSLGIDACFSRAVKALSDTDEIYVDFDIDVVDRSFAPGAPAALPGGLPSSDLLKAARMAGANAHIRVIDIVEVDPMRDVAEITVRLAALVALNFYAGVAARG